MSNQENSKPDIRQLFDKIKTEYISKSISLFDHIDQPYKEIIKRMAEENMKLKEEIALLKNKPKTKNRAQRRQEQKKIKKSKK